MADPITIYADLADLDHGVGAASIVDMDPADKTAALERSSRLMDSFFRPRFTLPFSYVGADVRGYCVAIAIAELLGGRGYNPEGVGDNLPEDRRKEAMSWLGSVKRGTIAPDVTDSRVQVEGVPTARGRVASASSRGWSDRGLNPNRRSGGFVGD